MACGLDEQQLLGSVWVPLMESLEDASSVRAWPEQAAGEKVWPSQTGTSAGQTALLHPTHSFMLPGSLYPRGRFKSAKGEEACNLLRPLGESGPQLGGFWPQGFIS